MAASFSALHTSPSHISFADRVHAASSDLELAGWISPEQSLRLRTIDGTTLYSFTSRPLARACHQGQWGVGRYWDVMCGGDGQGLPIPFYTLATIVDVASLHGPRRPSVLRLELGCLCERDRVAYEGMMARLSCESSNIPGTMAVSHHMLDPASTVVWDATRHIRPLPHMIPYPLTRLSRGDVVLVEALPSRDRRTSGWQTTVELLALYILLESP